eukprot:926592-Rhodomonas_salina.1
MGKGTERKSGISSFHTPRVIQRSVSSFLTEMQHTWWWVGTISDITVGSRNTSYHQRHDGDHVDLVGGVMAMKIA